MPRCERRPDLILVDELAHTNATGSRHAKRYLDVEELLKQGIDVYTTLNIQHIESLNDVVAQITRVRVRETVPDAVVDRADAVELVDLTPEDLIQRLKEGKVYVPQQAERALKNYFSPANLTALRELALRRTAERVDEQLLEEMQARAIPGPWAAGERLLVCVGEDPRSPALVRYAKRLPIACMPPGRRCASRRRAARNSPRPSATASPRPCGLPSASVREAITLPSRARRVADDVIGFAHRNNVTQIVIGKSTRSRWFEILHGSVVHDLVRRAGNIGVHVIPGETDRRGACRRQSSCRRTGRVRFDPLPYIVALLAVAIALGIGMLLRPMLGVENVDLVFLTAIVGVAVRYGLWPSLTGDRGRLAQPTTSSSCRRSTPSRSPIRPISPPSCCSPSLPSSFPISPPAARRRPSRPRSACATVELLYAFSRKLAGAGPLDDVLWATSYQIASMLKVRVVVLLPEAGSIAVKGGYPPEDSLEEADHAAARWAWDKDRPTGRESDTLPGAKWLFLPMRTGRGPRRHRRHHPRWARAFADAPTRSGCWMRSPTRAPWPSSACISWRISSASVGPPRRIACARRC